MEQEELRQLKERQAKRRKLFEAARELGARS
jgi:hypothetical protein